MWQHVHDIIDDGSLLSISTTDIICHEYKIRNIAHLKDYKHHVNHLALSGTCQTANRTLPVLLKTCEIKIASHLSWNKFAYTQVMSNLKKSRPEVNALKSFNIQGAHLFENRNHNIYAPDAPDPLAPLLSIFCSGVRGLDKKA